MTKTGHKKVHEIYKWLNKGNFYLSSLGIYWSAEVGTKYKISAQCLQIVPDRPAKPLGHFV